VDRVLAEFRVVRPLELVQRLCGGVGEVGTKDSCRDSRATEDAAETWLRIQKETLAHR
jgi:hypothetical protein